MEYTDDVMEIIINAYLEKGIVTRNEYPGIDSRPFGRGLEAEMRRRGYDNVDYVEEEVGNYYDYSGALYNESLYDMYSAKEYLRTHVLSTDI